MAGLFVVAGIAMVDRHRQKRQAKEAKIVYNDIRYAALQEETRQRQEETRQRLAQSPPPVSSHADTLRLLTSTSPSPSSSPAPSPVSSDAHTLRLLTSHDLTPVELNLDANVEQRKPVRPVLKSRRTSWYDPRSWSEKKARRATRVEVSPWNYS